jgi:uncharacterized membrane protein
MISVLSMIWLIFVVYLDIQHALFPKTTIGGLKILAAALILFALVRFMGNLSARLYRLLTGNRNKRGAFAPSSHTPS